MKHLFRGTVMGFEKKQEGIYFDADNYSQKEADEQFKRYRGVNSRGYGYTGFEFDGQKYHDVAYLGLFEDDKLPHNNNELMDYLEQRGERREFKKLK